LVVGALEVRAEPQVHLVLILFLVLYLLRAVVLVVLIHPLLEYQVALVVVQIMVAVVFTAQLVRVSPIKVTLVDCLGLVQTIQAEAEGALEQLD
jgi:hypothetical protein